MQKTLFITTLLAFFMVAPLAHAQETNGCRPVFGGGTSCIQTGSLLLDKKFRNPQGQFVDQAELTDPRFGADQPVVFQITVKNTSTRGMSDITVTDTLPQYLTFVKGMGQFDKATGVLTTPINRLEAGQTSTITIETKVVTAASLPDNPSLCVVNVATATQGRNTSSDNTQFCLEKTAAAQPTMQTRQASPQAAAPAQKPPVLQAPPVTTAPKTGPEALTYLTIIPAGLIGYYLRRQTTK